MAATVTIHEKINIGRTESLYIGEVTLDNSYATGGEVVNFVTASGLAGPEKMKSVMLGQTAGYLLEFIRSSQKLKAFRDATPAAAAALPEVASTTDLSAVVVPFWGIGPS